MAESSPSPRASLLKMLIEIGPLAIFFVANSRWGIFTATAVFMVAIVVSLAVSYAMERKLPLMPMITAVVVLVFGGLTLLLNDELFIKLKPTIVNGRRLAQAHAALGPVFYSARGAERGGVAQLQHRHLGQLQGVRHHAPHRCFQPGADAAAATLPAG
jgi:hypothetical protein